MSKCQNETTTARKQYIKTVYNNVLEETPPEMRAHLTKNYYASTVASKLNFMWAESYIYQVLFGKKSGSK